MDADKCPHLNIQHAGTKGRRWFMCKNCSSWWPKEPEEWIE